jgi:predicted PurR-regulated permease PerM
LPINQRARFLEVLDEIGRSLWWWVLGRIAGMLIIGVLSTVGLYLIGIPMALPLGVMAGFLNFIPNVGPTLALGPPLLFGLQQGPTTALYVFCWYLGLQFVETYIISPLIAQRQIYLPPGVTIPVQVLFGLVGGVFGVAMATPLAAVVMVVVREYYVKETLGDRSDGLKDMPGLPAA